MGLKKTSNGKGKRFALRNFPIFFWVFLVALTVEFNFGDIQADARSAQCIRLQNQLSAASIGGVQVRRTSNRFRQYDQAVKQQIAQISKTQNMASRNGCRRNSAFGRNASTCNRIFQTLGQMNANLANLERQRARLAPRNGLRHSSNRNSIIRAMNRLGCFADGVRRQQVNLQPRRRSLVEQIFGTRTFQNDGSDRGFDQFDTRVMSRSRLFRTMCVRKKDGYYFPVSFSTTRERFEFDERICQSKCPSSDMALYFYAMPSQVSEDMVSFRGGIPYRDLPTAFAYRTKFNPEASCKFNSGILQEIAGSAGEEFGLRDVGDPKEQRIGKPEFRKDRGLDPETLANQHGRFDESVIVGLLTKPTKTEKSHVLSKDQRRVRVVGPAFFPVQ